MDTIGLLAAWAGIISFLLAAILSLTVSTYLKISPLSRWWARTSTMRAERRTKKLQADLAVDYPPNNAYLAELISLFGALILTLVAGVALVIICIQILDLGPALLASILPFDINSKLITRATGIFLLVACYLFTFRIAYLSAQIRRKRLPHTPRYERFARFELTELRGRLAAKAERAEF